MTEQDANESPEAEESGTDVPQPTNPDFHRMMEMYESDAEKARAAKAEAIARLSQLGTDDEILNDIGLDMSALRQEP